ncbi:MULTISPECIES: hypothetical protein [Bacillus]|uniref:hypothetical protein n=1 Tax=Bacillus TaxID=1386 RepID=UPI000BB8AEE5|nr:MULTISPECIES: hypothetical protein [Bacillus]
MKGFFITILILIGFGFGAYKLGHLYIENKVTDYVGSDLVTSGDLALAKEFVSKSPTLKAYISEGAVVETENLAFQTKEEAAIVVMRNLKFSEIQEITSLTQDELTEEKVLDVLDMLELRLSEEEITALKAVVYRELFE